MTTKVVHRGDTRVEAAMDLRQLSNCRRIALLLGGTFDPSGGMYEYGKAWHRQLSDTGWMVTLFASKSIAEDSDAEDAEVVIETGSQKYSYSQLALGSFWRSSYWKRFITRIIDGVRKNNIGIVHLVDRPVYAASIAAALRNAFPELLIVSTIHDPAWHQEHISLLGALLKYWDDQRLIWLSKHRTLWLHVHNRLLTKGTGFDGSERIVEMPHPRPQPYS